MLCSVFFLIFLSGLLYAAVNDIATMTIPNWLSLGYLGLFLVVALLLGQSWSLIGMHYLAGAIALAVCFGLFSLGVFGGGDAKLIPAIMVWLGPSAVTSYIYGIALAGGLLAVLVLSSRKFVPVNYVPGFLYRSVVQGPGIPYAVAIAFGAIWALNASPFMSFLIQSTSFGSLTMP